MAKDSTTPAPAENAPAEADTQTAPASDTDANSPAVTGTKDWEAEAKAAERRRAAAQAEMHKVKQELARLHQQAEEDAEPDEDEDGEAAQRTVRRASRREAELESQNAELQWTIARAVYPEDVIDAYASAAELLEAAQTAADYVGAFEAYHQRRSQGATPQQAAAAPPSPQPRIEATRPEPDLTGLNNQAAEAAKKRDLAGWVGALLRPQE